MLKDVKRNSCCIFKSPMNYAFPVINKQEIYDGDAKKKYYSDKVQTSFGPRDVFYD